MHWLTFTPTGLRAIREFSIDKRPPANVGGRQSVAWSVVLDDKQVLLADGKKLEDLPGTVHLSIGDPAQGSSRGDGVNARWGLHLFPDIEHHVADYIIDLSLSAKLFHRLEQLVATGRLPKLEVGISSGETSRLKPVHVWDFDELKWDNNPTDSDGLAIEACRFTLDLGRGDRGPVPNNAPKTYSLAPAREGDIQELGDIVAKAVERIERQGKQNRVPLWIIAAVLVYLLLRRYL